jgi:hypothetical protein
MERVTKISKLSNNGINNQLIEYGSVFPLRIMANNKQGICEFGSYAYFMEDQETSCTYVYSSGVASYLKNLAKTFITTNGVAYVRPIVNCNNTENNTITTIRYTISVNNDLSISNIAVECAYSTANYYVPGLIYSTHTSVQFSGTSNKLTSGNPGYVIGKPLILSATLQAIVSTDVILYLSQLSYYCTSQENSSTITNSILYGQDLNMQCLLICDQSGSFYSNFNNIKYIAKTGAASLSTANVTIVM